MITRSLRTRSVAAAAVTGLALLTTSCAADDAPETAPPADSSAADTPAADGDSDSPSDAEPAESFQEEELDGALVASFPGGVPLYPGDVVSSLAVLGEVSERPEWNVTIATDDALEVVDAAIRDDYTSDGWEIRTEMDHMDGHLLVTGKDGYTVSITYSSAGGAVSINYGVSS